MVGYLQVQKTTEPCGWGEERRARKGPNRPAPDIHYGLRVGEPALLSGGAWQGQLIISSANWATPEPLKQT